MKNFNPQAALGEFWTESSSERKLVGWLDLSSRFPHITTHGQLTAPINWRQVGKGRFEGEDTEDGISDEKITIYGSLANSPSCNVTIFDAITVSRSFPLAINENEAGVHTLQGTWAVIGAHVQSGTKFDSVRIKFTNLDKWIFVSGFSASLREDLSYQKIEYRRPTPQFAEIPRSMGRVSVEHAPTLPSISRQDQASIRQHSFLCFSELECSSLDEVYGLYISPTLSLVSAMMQAPCSLTELQVSIGEDKLLQVRHPVIEHSAKPSDIKPGHEYVYLPHVSIDVLARWLSKAQSLDPIGGILLASLRGSKDQSLEGKILQLAACIEGFDRRKHQTDIRVEESLAEIARQAAKEAISSAAGPEIADRAASSLLHFHEPTYKERLKRTVAPVEEAVPGITGRTNRWMRKIINARNGFAHLLEGQQDWDQNVVLHESLQWIIGIAIMLEAGVSKETIRERTNEHEGYKFFKRKAAVYASEVYGA